MAVIRGGYWRSSKANYFPPESIQTRYFTHLFYASVAIDEIDDQTYQIRLSDIDQTWIGRFTQTMFNNNANVKCILSIGEDTEAGRTTLSNMISTPDGRKSFIRDSINKALQYGFHGLDLYWKYPATANEFDMPNLSLLFKEWNDSLKEEHNRTGNPKLSLSTIVYFAPKFFPADDNKAYPFKSIKDNVDFVNLVCYDYSGSQDVEVTAEHALLYDQHDEMSTHYGISSWIDDAGVPEGKLVMGLPLYGRRWELVDRNENGIGARATAVGPMDYSDILQFNGVHQANLHVVNDKTVSTYSYAGQAWIGYDSKFSIKGKVQYAKDHALGGYFFWALGMDKDYELPEQAFDTWN
ncbi:hypothetical protein CMV_020276 [Castanea mollissima]|uniref:GH18 domain-containing protein n=1 Tax=Castanea mollissima TaxID=60419 RepID=A0A8J4QQZ5_9ROSI|nr:hypothetical protein CMV_020276 [Castanea mollissima]